MLYLCNVGNLTIFSPISRHTLLFFSLSPCGTCFRPLLHPTIDDDDRGSDTTPDDHIGLIGQIKGREGRETQFHFSFFARIDGQSG